MSGSVRIFLRGYFQCSPDSFEPRMRSVELSSDALLEHINKGFEVIGAEAQTSNTAELAATDSQQPQGKMPPDQQVCIHIEICSLRSRYPIWCPWPCGHYRPMR
jgi:hypothetical protein